LSGGGDERMYRCERVGWFGMQNPGTGVERGLEDTILMIDVIDERLWRAWLLYLSLSNFVLKLHLDDLMSANRVFPLRLAYFST
jgi:hypothetical protein